MSYTCIITKSISIVLTLMIVCLVSVGCHSDKGDLTISQVFKFAGDNRLELEKVLTHYKNDSLKLEAAKFLIKNLPFHYHYNYDPINSYYSDFHDIVSNHVDIDCATDSLKKKYGTAPLSNLSLTNDVRTISADYLIANIDQAFMAWENTPWGKELDFSDFCEKILPYKTANEEFEEWRIPYYKRFKPILDSLLNDNSPLTACQILYDSIINGKWIFVPDSHLPHRSAMFLLDKRSGSCAEYSIFMTHVMRALAIPGGIDMIIQNPDFSYRAHYWNFVSDLSGNDVDYTLYQKRPDPENIGPPNRVLGKVYRKNFNIQKSSLPYEYPHLSIPNSLKNILLSDVSDKYIKGVDICLDVDDSIKNGEILYISVFNNVEWIPIGWEKVKNGKIQFNNLEPGIVYGITDFKDQTNTRVDFPVLIDKDRKINILRPDSASLQKVRLQRKYPLKLVWYRDRMAGGEFQAANNIEFNNAVTLHTIPEAKTFPFDTIEINNKSKFKYIRYLSAPKSNNNMAELIIKDENDQKITGKTIGTEGSFNNNKKKTKYAVFDDDPLTFYNAKDWMYGWVGLEFDFPQKIKNIEYIFRNDDNYIRPGDMYELFYFTKNGTESLGIRTGTNNRVLEYDSVPENALLWLRNRTRGREERIFTYENNKQIWW